MRGLLGAVLVFITTALPVTAASLEERLAPCLACHGEKGQSEQPEVPSLGAQPAFYVMVQLYMFREKLRTVEIMNAMTQGATDDDLRSMADAIAKLPPPPLEEHPLVKHYGMAPEHLALTKAHRQVEGDHRAAAWSAILAHVSPTRRGTVVRAMNEALERWLAYRDEVASMCGIARDHNDSAASAA